MTYVGPRVPVVRTRGLGCVKTSGCVSLQGQIHTSVVLVWEAVVRRMQESFKLQEVGHPENAKLKQTIL